MEDYIKWLRKKAGHGTLINKNNETLELKYFDLNDVPTLFCKQHQDILDDIKSGKEYIFR